MLNCEKESAARHWERESEERERERKQGVFLQSARLFFTQTRTHNFIQIDLLMQDYTEVLWHCVQKENYVSVSEIYVCQFRFYNTDPSYENAHNYERQRDATNLIIF